MNASPPPPGTSSTASPSDEGYKAGVLRTGLSASGAFAGGVALGLLLATLSLGVLFCYLSRWLGGDASRMGGGFFAGAGQGNWTGLIWALLSPRVLVAVLLTAMMPLYFIAGLQLARARALARVVRRYGEGLTQRLTEAVAAGIEAMPRAHQALHRGSDLLSPNDIAARVEPWFGRGPAVRVVVGFVLNRLPLADIRRQWQEVRAEHGVEAQADDGALRSLLHTHIHAGLQDLVAPSYRWLWGLAGAQALLLVLGVWLT